MFRWLGRETRRELGFNVGEEKERLPWSRCIIFWVGRENATQHNYSFCSIIFWVGWVGVQSRGEERRVQSREGKGEECRAK
jgi:hypothetical protein